MELASSLALRRVCRAAVAGSSLVRRHTRAAVHVRCLSGSPPREPWWSKLNPFKKLDPEAKRVKDEKHEIIMERLRRSVFYDAKQAPTEKLFTAEAKPFVNKSALPFPAVSVDMIAGGTSVDLAHYFSNKVTLVTVSFQAHGKMQSDMWHAPFLQAFSDDTGNLVKGVQVLDIVYLEGWFFRTFRNVLLKSTRSTTAPAMVPHTAIRFETSTPAAEMFCHRLRMHNRLMGYAFVVDWTGCVRWMAQYLPAEGEIPALITATSTLRKQLGSDRG